MKQATKSAADHIRAELKADRTQTAKDVLNKLAAKGITVTAQSVYQVRSADRQKRKAKSPGRPKNGKKKGELTDCIIAILYERPEGLTDKELSKEVRKVYKTSAKADSFLAGLRNRLYALVGQGRIIKHNPSKKYILTDKERGKSKTATTTASQVLGTIALDQKLLYDVKELVDGFGEAVDKVMALEVQCATKGVSLVQYIETVKKLGK